jgi:hypothetical protein
LRKPRLSSNEVVAPEEEEEEAYGESTVPPCPVSV